MKTLYVTDLDGTLLNTHDSINEYSINKINEYVESGTYFTYATARSLSSAAVVTKGLKIKLPVIVYNGAMIISPDTGKVMTSISFTNEEIQEVINTLTEYKIFPLVYSYIEETEKVSWVQKYENDGMRRYLNNRKGDRRLRPCNTEEGLYDGKPFYFTCIGEKNELLPIYNKFNKAPGYRCTLQQELYRPEYWCEIMPAKATKSNAIRKLSGLMKFERIISFGDSINDIPMFEASDECYAVSNAVEELKKAATGVIMSNDEDGVAKWMEKTIR